MVNDNPQDPSRYYEALDYYHTAFGLYQAYIDKECHLSAFKDYISQKKELINFVLEEDNNISLFSQIAGTLKSLGNTPKATRVKDCIQVMLDLGADPNQKAGLRTFGNTLLHWLIANDRPNYAVEFINMETGPDNKIDFEIMDRSFKTPLLFIVGRKYLYGRHGDRLKDANQELIEELVKLDADINIADTICNTPLHIACVKRDVDAVKALLSSSTLTPQSLRARNNLKKNPTDMLDLSYGESRDIICNVYNCDIDDIIQKRTVNSPEAEQNAEQIRQLIRDKQNELGAPEESRIRAEFIGGHNNDRCPSR